MAGRNYALSLHPRDLVEFAEGIDASRDCSRLLRANTVLDLSREHVTAAVLCDAAFRARV